MVRYADRRSDAHRLGLSELLVEGGFFHFLSFFFLLMLGGKGCSGC